MGEITEKEKRVLCSLLGSQIVGSLSSSLHITGRTLSSPSDVTAAASPLAFEEEEAARDVADDWPSNWAVR